MKDVDKMSERELRGKLRSTRALLAAAKCPHINCITDWQGKCSWCVKRSALLA